MANKSGAQRNTSRWQPYGWLGAGAVALGVGVALAGAGTAHADDTSTSAATSSVRPAAAASATAVKSSRSSSSPSRTARAVREAPRSSASSRAVPRSAAVLSRRPQVPAAAVTAAPSGVVTPVPSQATIAVTNWFSSTRSWLYQFDGPLAEGLRNTLTGLQRTLFSPAPAVKPVQLTPWTPGEEILGELRYVQPGGAGVGFQLTQAPTLGTVQLLSDGIYTYMPGAGFTGTDTFTAQVTSAGFNILEPSTPRTESVTVQITPTPPQQSNRAIIQNLSGQAIYWDFNAFKVEPGYEDYIWNVPKAPLVIPIGGTFTFNYDSYFWNSWYANFVFKACADTKCTGAINGILRSPTYNWKLDFYNSSKGASVDFGNAYGGQKLNFKSSSYDPTNCKQANICLYDPPDTKVTITGDQAQKQAEILKAVCDSGAGNCRFDLISSASTTARQLLWYFDNFDSVPRNVEYGEGTTVAATSSFGTKYSTETSAVLGQKDVFNIAFKTVSETSTSVTDSLSKTHTWKVAVTLDSGRRLNVYASVPVTRATGILTATVANTTFRLPDVYFDFIDTDTKKTIGTAIETQPISTTAA